MLDDPNIDPRLLLQRLNALEKEVTTLKANSMVFSANQQGPLPGFVKAVRVNDPNLAASMWVNYTNAGPGQGPYSAVTDANNVIRAEWGNLAANGISPAQYGFRANAADTTPIFDSLGLIAVMKLLGMNNSTGPPNIVGPATNSTIGGTSVTFSLTRQQNVLTFFLLTANTTGGTGNFAYMNAVADGSQTGINHHAMVFSANSELQNCMFLRFDTLASGSHTILQSADVDNGQTMGFFGSATLVFGLGA